MSKATNIIFVEIKDTIFRGHNSGESVFFSSANTLNGGKAMNEATKKTLSQFKELTDSEKHDARQKFVRMKDATDMYNMSRPKMTL